MKAHIINLERRIDRKASQIAECKRVGIEPIIHKAVDGQREFFKMATTRRMRGHFGCLQSHRNVLRAIKGTSNYHLIVEDDVLFIDDVVESIQNHIKQLPEEWTMCYFGGHIHTMENAIEDFNGSFWYARNVLGLYCYVVKDEAIDDILETFESRLWKADMVAIDYQQKRDVYITKKCHAWVKEDYSDICHEVITPNLKY